MIARFQIFEVLRFIGIKTSMAYQGFEPGTSHSEVRRTNHCAIEAPFHRILYFLLVQNFKTLKPQTLKLYNLRTLKS
jgi:hypothetical protein